ncbi:hypothetical protein FRC19_002325 [Serendipita sp. 401]|nr:hypothetical protein FRC19_002325 [Serendipita sp. 401]KAG8846777.1 hypothetical protein FRC20_002917 [Serendipita sp. 405]
MMIDTKALPPSYEDAVEHPGTDMRSKAPLDDKQVDEMMIDGGDPRPRPRSTRTASYIHPPYDEPYTGRMPSPSTSTAPAPIIRQLSQSQPQVQAPPAFEEQQVAQTTPTYIWRHPITNETYDTGLPHDHPDVHCLESGHIPRTRYGLVGILSTIFWFPLGLLVMMHDRSVECERCSRVLVDRNRRYGCNPNKLFKQGQKVVEKLQRDGSRKVWKMQTEGKRRLGQLQVEGTRKWNEWETKGNKWAEKSQRRQEKWASKMERKQEKWAHKAERRDARYAAWVERKHRKGCGKVYTACGH